MCGIAGIISRDSINVPCLLKMSQTLRHRGPDDEGFLISDLRSKPLFLKGPDTISTIDLEPLKSHHNNTSFKLGFIHRRLSIIDLSDAGHQPMTFADSNLSIIFNGEVYNYKEIKTELENAGHTFKTNSDTEVILQAYSKWGKSCVTKFIGMWAFSIYDLAKNEVFFSRDRFGIKPLYYYWDSKTFAFSSEIKALFDVPGIYPKGLFDETFEYISFGALSNSDKTLYKNIEQLSPGTNLIFNLSTHSFNFEKYYDLESESAKIKLGKNSSEEFGSLLIDSINIHLRADVEIGSALSGGLDSSTIVAIASGMLGEKNFKTFTATYNEKEIDESYYSKLVSKQFKNVTPFYATPTSKSYWQNIDKLIWHQDLPINSTSMFAQWEVMKAASGQKIKVLLDGQGADEILGGYYNFAGIHLIQLLKGLRFSAFNSEKKALKENFTPNINAAVGRAGFYFLPKGLQRTARSKKRLSFDFLSSDTQAFISRINVPERGGKSFREQSLLSIKYGMQDLLRYEDRNSMAFSIESRVPFLDHRLAEFCLALPNDEKINKGWTKLILRKQAEKLLPKEVAWRKDKMGFLTPQQVWKNESKKELLELINESEVPHFINKDYLIRLCNESLTNSSHLSEFWKMISFIKWVNIYNITY